MQSRPVKVASRYGTVTEIHYIDLGYNSNPSRVDTALHNTTFDMLDTALPLLSRRGLALIVPEDPVVLDQIFVTHGSGSFSDGDGLLESASMLR